MLSGGISAAALVVVPTALLWLIAYRAAEAAAALHAALKRRRRELPPRATGHLPLLGHALAFKRDPAAFITQQCREVGSCFTLYLAGKKMIVVGHDRGVVKQVAHASESALSARQAVTMSV